MGRRKFMRQVGVGAAATAALVGVTDVVGMKSAVAATTKDDPKANKAATIRAAKEIHAKKVKEVRARTGSEKIATIITCCNLSAGHCAGGCRPAGIWCHICCNSRGSCAYDCAGGAHNYCFSG
jgi:hypothetical protein